jgi:hypothetical protein
MPHTVKNSSQHNGLPLDKDSLFVPLCKGGGCLSKYNAPNDSIEDRPLMGENQDLFVPRAKEDRLLKGSKEDRPLMAKSSKQDRPLVGENQELFVPQGPSSPQRVTVRS